MADEPALDAKYEGLRRGLRSRRRDDHALDLFRRAEANLADVRQVDRILLELGRFYNPLTNRPIVDLATRRSIVERLGAGGGGPPAAPRPLRSPKRGAAAAGGKGGPPPPRVTRGDTKKPTPAGGPAERIVVLRRAWEEIASPEI